MRTVAALRQIVEAQASEQSATISGPCCFRQRAQALPEMDRRPVVTDTIIEDSRWHAVDLPGLAERAAQATLAHLGLSQDGWEIAVLGCDDARIAALGAEFRGKSRPTNVLSWPVQNRSPAAPGARPAPPDPQQPELGDIAIAWETCVAEAAGAGLPLPDHVTHLIVHAVLHLLGHDHERDDDATLMERLESEILGKMGLADPYRNGSRAF
mgnify:CR=1 FL=1